MEKQIDSSVVIEGIKDMLTKKGINPSESNIRISRNAMLWAMKRIGAVPATSSKSACYKWMVGAIEKWPGFPLLDKRTRAGRWWVFNPAAAFDPDNAPV